MVSNLIVAICAVIPLFFLMLVGFAVKKMRLLTELELAHVNRMVFKIFFFFMMFYNIYTTDLAETFRPHLMLFGAVGVLASALIGGIIFIQGVLYWPLVVLALQHPRVIRAIRRVQRSVDRLLGGLLLALGIKVALS